MVEVFITNVNDHTWASRLISAIHRNFVRYTANFDLQDDDRILRVECNSDDIEPIPVIRLLNEFGFSASILPDSIEIFKKNINHVKPIKSI